MTQGKMLQMSGVVVDLIYQIDSVPAPGGEASARVCAINAGGGFNAMMAAKRAGLDVAYGGAHGTGLFADIVRREIADAGIAVLQPQSAFADQGNCVVLVDRLGERTFVSKDGADGILDDALLEPIDHSLFDWILLSGYALAHAGSRIAMHSWLSQLPGDARFVFDPSPSVDNIPTAILEDAISKATWVSANAYEARAITGRTSPEAAAAALSEKLQDNGCGAVVRCGVDGCWLASRGQSPLRIDPFAVDTVDTNGAGDAHVGAFIAALSKGASPVDAARYANAAAALSTIRFGAATAPEHSEIQELLNQRNSSDRDLTPEKKTVQSRRGNQEGRPAI